MDNSIKPPFKLGRVKVITSPRETSDILTFPRQEFFIIILVLSRDKMCYNQ